MNMMKRLFAFSLVLSMAFLAQVAISAHQPTSLIPKSVSGEVVAVDASKNEMVVKSSTGSEVRLVVNDSTKVTKGGKASTLADVKPGVKVSIAAAEAEGKLVAQSIQVE